LILSTESLDIPYFPLQAKSLYANLRLADQNGYGEIVILCKNCKDEAILNRLEKITSEGNSH
jgi:hypothetical protein